MKITISPVRATRKFKLSALLNPRAKMKYKHESTASSTVHRY
jgi:hypothetical protein